MNLYRFNIEIFKLYEKTRLNMRTQNINLIIIALMIIALNLPGQMHITNTNTPFVINFDQTFHDVNNGIFTGDGFRPNPNPGQIDSDAFRVSGLSDGAVRFGEVGATGDFARGTANVNVNTGGVYSFEVESGNFTLGAKPRGGDFRPGSFTLLIINETGEPVNSTRVAYNLYYLNSVDRSTQVDFAWSPDDNNYNSAPSASVASPTQSSPLPVWRKNQQNITISSILQPGDSLYLRWSISDNGGKGPGNDQIGIDSINVVMESSAFLPVDWVSFKANQKASNVELFWETATEINNDHFEIEHSQDGRLWQMLGSVPSSDDRGAQKYHFIHETPVEGMNYYRIKQIDIDGSIDYSHVEKVYYDRNEQEALSVYPNPVENAFSIENFHTKNITAVRIINNRGKILDRWDDDIPDKINVSSYPEGLYWISYKEDGEIKRKKFIVK